jgi:hypothetical protein
MKKSTKTLLRWVLLIFMFLAIWQFLTPSHPPGGPSRVAPSSQPILLGTWLPTVAIAATLVSALVAYRRIIVLPTHAGNLAIFNANGYVAAGRLDDAESAIASLENSRLPLFRLMFHVERAVILMARGEPDEALAELAPIDGAPSGRLFRGQQRMARLQGKSVRAFLRASTGDAAGARADIATVRAEPDAEPMLLARASLAEARLLDAAQDRAALGALLERDRWLLLQATGGREKALVRAYEGMLEASLSSVYRQRADRVVTDEGAAAEDAAWIAKFAPNAAPFVRSSLPAGGAGDVRMKAPSEEARRKLEARTMPRKVKRAGSATLGIWVVLVLAFAVLWGAMPVMSFRSSWLIPVIVIAVVVALVGWIARGLRRQLRHTKRINAALRVLGAGALPSDDLALDGATARHRAHAAHVLAEAALRSGDPKRALEQCDLAFEALAEASNGTLPAPTVREDGSPPNWDLTRVLSAQRAFALAALGRVDDAWAEVAWAKGYPNGLTVLRVSLLAHLRAKDWAGAAEVVDARDPTVVLPVRDEVLAEMVRFLGRPASRTTAAAMVIRAELRRDRTLAPWMDAMAPKVLRAFERASAELESAQGTSLAP